MATSCAIAGWVGIGLVEFLRAHHDAQLIGANTLREEQGPEGRGWDYGIDDEMLRTYRQETLGLGRGF